MAKTNLNLSIRSEIWVTSANGYGATNTKVRRWTTVQKNVGSDITYTDDANLGGKFTVNTDGIYNISYVDSMGAGTFLGIVKNGTQGTTNVGPTITSSTLLTIQQIVANAIGSTSVTVNLSAGDYVWGQTEGSATTAGTIQMFRIVKVNK
jgi:hypothetical protein